MTATIKSIKEQLRFLTNELEKLEQKYEIKHKNLTETKFNKFKNQVGQLVSYKDLDYKLEYIGYTKYGPRARLSGLYDKFEFWVDIEDINDPRPLAKMPEVCVPPWGPVPEDEYYYDDFTPMEEF